MKPETKLQVFILGYCAFLWSTNWNLDHDYDRDNGLVSSSIDLRAMGILTGLIASYVISRRIWKLTHKFLDRSIRVPSDFRLWGEWKFLLLLLPLLVEAGHQSSGVADDGAGVNTVFQYGGDPSAYSFLFSGMAIMLFQILVRLEMLNPDDNAEQGVPGEPAAAVN